MTNYETARRLVSFLTAADITAFNATTEKTLWIDYNVIDPAGLRRTTGLREAIERDLDITSLPWFFRDLCRFPRVQSIVAQCGDVFELNDTYLDACPQRLTYGPNAAANLDGGDCWYQPNLPFGA